MLVYVIQLLHCPLHQSLPLLLFHFSMSFLYQIIFASDLYQISFLLHVSSRFPKSLHTWHIQSCLFLESHNALYHDHGACCQPNRHSIRCHHYKCENLCLFWNYFPSLHNKLQSFLNSIQAAIFLFHELYHQAIDPHIKQIYHILSYQILRRQSFHLSLNLRLAFSMHLYSIHL